MVKVIFLSKISYKNKMGEKSDLKAPQKEVRQYKKIKKNKNMKNNLLIFTTLIVGLLFTVSCKKQEVQIVDVKNERLLNDSKTNIKTDPKFSIGNEGRFLIFKTEQGYGKAVNNPDSLTNIELLRVLDDSKFTSYYQIIQKDPKLQEDNPFKYGEILSRFINKDFIVQIGNYLFKVEPTEQKVYALFEGDIQYYSDLVAKNTSNTAILVFSTDDEVLEILKVTTKPTQSDVEKGLFCNDPKAPEKESASNIVYFQSGGFNSQTENFKGTIYYRKFGVWFILGANTYFSFFGANSNTYGHWVQIENSSYAQRCGSSVSNYSHPWRSMINGMYVGLGGEKIFRWYSGAKKLKSYNFKARIRCENPIIPQGGNSYTTYFTNYMQITG